MLTNLEGLGPGHHKAHLIEVELFARELCENHVGVMDGIEGAAQNANPHG